MGLSPRDAAGSADGRGIRSYVGAPASSPEAKDWNDASQSCTSKRGPGHRASDCAAPQPGHRAHPPRADRDHRPEGEELRPFVERLITIADAASPPATATSSCSTRAGWSSSTSTPRRASCSTTSRRATSRGRAVTRGCCVSDSAVATAPTSRRWSSSAASSIPNAEVGESHGAAVSEEVRWPAAEGSGRTRPRQEGCTAKTPTPVRRGATAKSRRRGRPADPKGEQQ